MSESLVPALRNTRTHRRIKKFLQFAALSGAAIAVQHAPIPLGGDVHLLLGSVFAWWACRLYGFPWGIALGVASAGQTYFLWGHGFATLTMGLEIPGSLLIGWLLLKRVPEPRSRQDRLLSIVRLRALMTALYWLVAGLPLVFLTYGAGLGMPFDDQASVAVKQSLNGIANVMLADGLFVLSGFFSIRTRVLISRRFSSAAIFTYLGGLALAALVYLVATVGGGLFAQISVGVLDVKLDQMTVAYAEVLHRRALHLRDELARGIAVGGGPISGLSAAALVFQRDGAGDWQLQRGDLAPDDLSLVREGAAAGRLVVATSNGLLVLAQSGGAMAGEYIVTEIGSGGRGDWPRTVGQSQYAYLSARAYDLHRAAYRPLIDNGTQGSLWLVGPGTRNPRMLALRQSRYVHVSGAYAWMHGRLKIEVGTREYLAMQRGYQLGLLLTLLLALCGTGALLFALASFFERQSLTLRDSIDGKNRLGGSFLTSEARALVLALHRAQQRWSMAAKAATQNADLLASVAEASHASIICMRPSGEIVYTNLQPAASARQCAANLLREAGPLSSDVSDTGSFLRTRQVVHKDDGSVVTMSWNMTREGSGLIVATGFDVTQELEELQARAREKKLLSMGELAAGFAHEINQPLNIIKMSCANLKRRLIKGGAEKGLVDKASRIDAQVDRASQFVLNLRRLAKAQPHTIQAVALKDLVCSIVTLIANQFALHGVRLKIEIEEGLVVDGDPSLLDQVLLNLLTNARESVVRRLEQCLLPEGMIFVRANRNDDNTISLSVEDNGEGLPEGDFDKIFEPFFSTKDAGTGLGLSLSKRIVEALGGRLEAEAIVGGARLRVTLKEASIPVPA